MSTQELNGVLLVPYQQAKQRTAHGRIEQMDINEFASKHSVKVKRDDCGDAVVMGLRAAHIYDGFADGRLGLFVSCPTVRRWNSTKKAMEAAGLIVKQSGSTEGCFTFDPTDTKQARLALKKVGARTRREQRAPSVAQLAARKAFADRRRNSVQAA